MGERHVRPGPGGGWLLSGVPGEYPTQEEAIARARDALEASDGGELVVSGAGGAVVRSETVKVTDPRFLSYRRGMRRFFTR